jgi:uncharacterized protein YbaP (TraB family)
MAPLRYFLILWLVASCRWTSAQDNALLWRISGGGSERPSYLYGTIHIICPDDLKLPDSLASAMQQTDRLFLEIDMDQPGMMLKTMRLSMQTRVTLKELFTPDAYAKVDRFLKDSVGMGAAMFNRMRPFTLLSALYSRMPRCPKSVSVEDKLMAMARKLRKEVKGLETIEEQFALFDRIPDSAQAGMILDLIDQFPKQQQEFMAMVDAYRREDLSTLASMMNASPDLVGFEELLLSGRNRKWVPVMREEMKRGSALFAVGAGHLSGDEGLLMLLRKAGFTVQPLR